MPKSVSITAVTIFVMIASMLIFLSLPFAIAGGGADTRVNHFGEGESITHDRAPADIVEGPAIEQMAHRCLSMHGCAQNHANSGCDMGKRTGMQKHDH